MVDYKKKSQEFQRKWGQIVAKAWMDPKFKKELVTHPEKVMREHGMDLHGKKAHILENNTHDIYLTIPEKPEGLSEEELKNLNAAFPTVSGCTSTCDQL